jgi:hypothetical protein
MSTENVPAGTVESSPNVIPDGSSQPPVMPSDEDSAPPAKTYTISLRRRIVTHLTVQAAIAGFSMLILAIILVVVTQVTSLSSVQTTVAVLGSVLILGMFFTFFLALGVSDTLAEYTTLPAG